MINSIDELLADVKTIGITGHVRPDGDCVGSTLGLYNYISDNYPGIKVDVYLEPIEEHFYYLNGSDKIISEPSVSPAYDLFFVLDCGDLARVASFAEKIFKKSAKTVCIDHHACNYAFADINHVLPDISSTCEAVFELLNPARISRNTADALYTGIIHDTGVFKYRCTSRRTMEIAGFLMEKGINYTDIIDDTFFRKTFIQNKVLGIALTESMLHADGRIVSSYIPFSVMKEYGITGRDMGGIIDQLRFTTGVEVALFMYGLVNGQIKGSLRSVNEIDVNVIANTFGGGGHIRAAGFTAATDPDKIIEIVITEFKKQCITE